MITINVTAIKAFICGVTFGVTAWTIYNSVTSNKNTKKVKVDKSPNCSNKEGS